MCGFTFELVHLNGKKLRLTNHNNKGVISHGYCKEIDKYGMKTEGHVGKLFIVFEVEFPESLTEEQMKALSELL